LSQKSLKGVDKVGTALLESAIAEMFPPNLTIRRCGWVRSENGPVQIEYEMGFDALGTPFFYDVATGLPPVMTPRDSEEDLQD
jgi:hypothetical protein